MLHCKMVRVCGRDCFINTTINLLVPLRVKKLINSLLQFKKSLFEKRRKREMGIWLPCEPDCDTKSCRIQFVSRGQSSVQTLLNLSCEVVVKSVTYVSVSVCTCAHMYKRLYYFLLENIFLEVRAISNHMT